MDTSKSRHRNKVGYIRDGRGRILGQERPDFFRNLFEGVLYTTADTSILCQAAAAGALAAVTQQVSLGASINNSKPKDGLTPLMCAVQSGSADVVKYLLDSQADVNEKDQVGSATRWLGATALFLATTKSRCDLVDLLVTAQANVDVLVGGSQSMTPLMYAAAHACNPDMVQCLVLRKAQVDFADSRGRTALMKAVRSADFNEDVVYQLAAMLADLEVVDKEGDTALTTAALQYRYIAVKTLILAGADPTVLTRTNGQYPTPLLVRLLSRESQSCADVLTACVTSVRLPARFRDGRHEAHMGSGFRTTHADFDVTDFLALSSEEQCQLPLLAALVPADASLLEKLNNFALSPVRVCTAVLPNICSPAVIDALARSPNDNLFQTDIAQAIITRMWRPVAKWHLLDTFLDLTVVATLCTIAFGLHSKTVQLPAGLLPVLTIIVLKSIIENLCGLAYIVSLLKHGHKIVDILLYRVLKKDMCFALLANAIDVAGVISVASFDVTLPWTVSFVSLLCATRWIRFLVCLRGFDSVGPSMLPIVSAVADSLVFSALLTILACGACHSYYVAMSGSDSASFAEIAQRVIRLGLLGDVDLGEFEGLKTFFTLSEDGTRWDPQDPAPSERQPLIYIFVLVTGLSVTVVMMSLWVGILGSHYDYYLDRNMQLFLRARANIIASSYSKPWWRLWALIMQRVKQVVTNTRLDEDEYLWWSRKCSDASRLSLRTTRSAIRFELGSSLGSIDERLLHLQQLVSYLVPEVGDCSGLPSHLFDDGHNSPTVVGTPVNGVLNGALKRKRARQAKHGMEKE